MADSEELKRIRERYQLEEQINKTIKDGTQNFSEYVDVQKKVVENYKLMRELQKKINELQALGTKEAEDEVKILQSQLDQLVQINKELSKSSVLAKAVGGQLKEWGKNIVGQFLPGIGEVYSSFLKIDALAHQTANTLGFQGSKLGLMRDNISFTRDEFINLGYDIEDAYKAQTALSEATGRQVMLTREASQAMAETARITGMEVDQLAGMVGEMEAFGLGAKQSSDIVLQLSRESAAMGLNSSKVIKSFQQNLGLMNKLNFKNGVKGLMEMAKFSEKFKISMTSVAAVADKVFRPEGAIEAAAQLQVLGGSLASLGDPFQLMYKARNSPEELAKSLTKAATASATFNAKTKEFKINANELDRLKEAAQALGMDYSELVETAKQGAKVKQFEGLLGGKGLDDDTMNALVGAAQMGEKGAFVTIKGEPKLLKDLSSREAKLFMDQSKNQQELAQQAMSLQNNLDSIKNKIMITFVKFFENNETMIKSFLQTVKSFVSGIINVVNKISGILGPKATLFTVLGLYFGGKATWAYLQGKIFGASAAASFNAGTKMSKIPGTTPTTPTTPPGTIPGTTPTTPPETTPTTSPGGGQSGVLGQIAQLSPAQILSVAVALVAIGAAIWLIADGMSHLVSAFKDLNGPQALGAIAGMSIIMGGFVAILYFLPPVIAAIGTAGEFAAPGLLAFGFSMLMVGGGIALAAYGMSILVSSFANLFSVIGPNGDSVMKAGLGFLAMAAGIGVLSFALVELSATALLAVVGLGVLLSATSAITATATSLESIGGGEGITKTIEAINKVDTDKLEALKDLSTWMALLGGTTTIKFDENLKVGGSIEITGAAGGKTNTDWINDPIFVSRLKEKIETSKSVDRKGGLSV